MRKFAWFASFLFLAGISMGILLFTPISVAAIGEVTPTPDPDAAVEEPLEDIDVEALVDEGLSDIQNGDFRSALAKMDVVIEFDDTVSLAYVIRGIANSQLGFADDATDDFTMAIDLEPWNADYYQLRGDVAFSDGALVDALLDYDQVIRINGFSSVAYLRRSNTNYGLGDSTAGDVDDFIARALSALGNGDVMSALGFLDEAIDIGEGLESLGNAYYIRAFANGNLGDSDAQLEDYEAALDANPNLHIVYLARGIYFRENGDIGAAGKDFYDRITIHGAETVTEEMVIGDTLEVQMAYRRVVEITFDGKAGQEISIAASDFGGAVVDPLMTLLDPDGNPIAGDDDFGGGLNALIDGFELPEDGTYTLLVSHAEGGYNFGFNGIVEVEITEE